MSSSIDSEPCFSVARSSKINEVAFHAANKTKRLTANKFYRQKLPNSTRSEECQIYSDHSRIVVKINGQEIGYVRFHNILDRSALKEDEFRFGSNIGYWCGYCVVPKEWYRIIAADGDELSALYRKYKGQLPEFTYTGGNSVVGWDHAHSYDDNHHSNLAAVVQEVLQVWSLF